MNLTAKRVQKLRRNPGRYRDGPGLSAVPGLILQVISPTNASWILRYERNGRERWMGLGPLWALQLSEARKKARAARQLLLDGVDPLEQKKATKAAQALEAAKALTFQEAANKYFVEHRGKWTNQKHAKQFLSTLSEYAFPKIGRLAVADIDTGLVLEVLKQGHKNYPDQPLWNAIPTTADRVRNRIELVLNWAHVHGFRAGDNNPARWQGHLKEALPTSGKIKKHNHHAALPYNEIQSFLTALRNLHGIAARALEFTILTAARTGETLGATWDEIDLQAKVWTVPAARMKMDREHRVPLSDRAVEVLKALPTEDGNNFVFIGKTRARLNDKGMLEVLKQLGHDDITVHGFRSTFRDWSAECTAFPNHVLEQALAHSVGSAVEAAYRRGDLLDKRRRLMADWAKFCSKPVGAAGNVTSITQRKAS
jgi:integrase